MAGTQGEGTMKGVAGLKARRQRILDVLLASESGFAQVDELAALLDVSRMTVHRDLDALVEQGLVNKRYGGVTVRATNVMESNFRFRWHVAEAEKRALAAASSHLIQPGEAVMLDDSTTAAHAAAALARVTPLTVISNGLGVVDALKEAPDIQLIALGGNYRARFNAFFGLQCEQAIASLRANAVLMSVSAVHEGVAYVQDQEVVKVKRALMDAADRRILLVQHQKFGASALHRLAELSEFDLVVVDAGLDDANQQELRDRGVVIHIA